MCQREVTYSNRHVLYAFYLSMLLRHSHGRVEARTSAWWIQQSTILHNAAAKAEQLNTFSSDIARRLTAKLLYGMAAFLAHPSNARGALWSSCV